jgi:hypothetical protein
MTERQLASMKKQKAFAWAKYYTEIAEEATNAAIIINMVQVPHNPPAVRELPPHITQEFYDMACQLRRKFECPCCLELVNKDNIKITTCGHIYCDMCLETLKAQADPKCAVCRRKI